MGFLFMIGTVRSDYCPDKEICVMLSAISCRFIVPGLLRAAAPVDNSPSVPSSPAQDEASGVSRLPPEAQIQAEQLRNEIHQRLSGVADDKPITVDSIQARYPSLGKDLIEGAVAAYRSLELEKPDHPLLALNLYEATALFAYTDNFYLDMNSQLRGPGCGRYPCAAQLICDLTSALEKMLALNQSDATVVKVYRGQYADVLQDMVQGRLLVDPGFLSTTRCSEVAESFSSSNLQVLFSDQGVDVSDLSAGSFEQEVLFRQGTPFDILLSHTLPYGSMRQVLSDSRLPDSTGRKYEQDLAGLES